MARLLKLSICLPIIILLFVTGCGSDSGGHSRNRDPFADYGLKEGDIITIEISSPDLSNAWSDGTSGNGKSNDGSTGGGSGTGDTGGAGETSSYQKTMTLDAGTTAELSANAYDFTGTRYADFPVKWSSDNEAVAMVDENTGKVTALSEGTAIITAQLKMSDGTVITDTVQVTVFPSPIGDRTWMTSDKSLPQPMWDHASAIWNGYLYVAGGNSSCDGQYQNCGFTRKVFYAQIHPDGSTGDFVSANSLPKALRGHSLLAYNGYLYVIGGIVQMQFEGPPYPDAANFETILNEKVYYAKINLDGSIGNWLETTPLFLPELEEQPDKAGLFAHSAFVHNGYIYVTGGWNEALKKNVRTLLIGPIQKDGSIQKWIYNPTSDLPYDLSKHTLVAATVNGESYLYIIGGNSGALGSLGSTGGTQTFHEEIYYAKIAKDDGIPYDWKLASNILRDPLIDHAAVVVDRYLFVMGGRNMDDNWPYNKYNSVYNYFIRDNGDLEPVKKIASLPVPLFHHTAAADKNGATGEFRIYVTGGASGDTEKQENRRDSVYYFLANPNP